jgi:formamidopyrimidine-DNA glycosylase
MPELPEVHTVAQQLRISFIGQKVKGLWCNWPRMLQPEPAALKLALTGRVITDIDRRAKYVVFAFQPAGWLLLHLRMSGRTSAEPAGTPPHKHVHFVMKFESGSELHFHDARKFGRVSFVTDLPAATAHLGVEPLSDAFSPEFLFDACRRRARLLKPALLDQSFIAGLGNIYTDEALHRARLHPLRRTNTLQRPEAERLHEAIVHVLREGIRCNGASIDWVYPGGSMQDNFRVYGRTGEACGNCGGEIRRLVVGQRGTHVCRRCQRAPRRAPGAR